jgi:pilus assembly protein CpaE
MPELSVVIVATDNEQRTVLQVLVDGTSVARTVHTCASFPVAGSDPVMRRVQAANPEVLLVDIPSDSPAIAMRAIELLQQELPETAVFAIGNLNQPQIIVSAMRAGAREFIERPTTTTDLLEAFVRLTTAQRRVQKEGLRGKVFTVVNAKGGSGATTVAVNLALALQSAHGQTALVDLAPLGRHTQSPPHGQFPAGELHDPAWRRSAVAGGNQRAGLDRTFHHRVCPAVRPAGNALSLCGRGQLLAPRCR